jgi:hypothetical protein
MQVTKIKSAKLKDTPPGQENPNLGFDKSKDTRSVCHSLSCVAFGPTTDPNVRIKMSKKAFQDWMEVASFISLSNYAIYYHELVKQCIKENLPVEEILGEMHLQVIEAWNLLATHKLGKDCFRKMDLEDVMNSDNPAELLRNNARAM